MHQSACSRLLKLLRPDRAGMGSMMKRIILAALASILALPAMAACPSTFQIKDNAGITGNVVYSDSSGNCLPNVTLNGGSAAVTQSGTWNINNVSGTVSLPTGAATSANQTTANSSLASLVAAINSNGQKTSANSSPVVIASDQSVLTFTGSGTAGTAASGVLTVQGIASMTPILANPGTAANWGIAAPAVSRRCRAGGCCPTSVK